MADGPCAELQVRDYGPGIAADRLPQLFAHPGEVAAPDQAASGGLGLGLFLCKELLTAQDGAIDVRSSVGKGTSFRCDCRCCARPPRRMTPRRA